MLRTLSYHFPLWEISQLYCPNPSTEFIISAEVLLISKKPFGCAHPVLVSWLSELPDDRSPTSLCTLFLPSSFFVVVVILLDLAFHLPCVGFTPEGG